MRKKLICILCSLICLSTAFDAAVYADRGGAEPYGSIGIGIGDYIQLGKYRDIPILWRYVADDENGKLILSDKVLCTKPFDSTPPTHTGSHIARPEQNYYVAPPNIPTYKCSNYWGDSNIRSWLNSKAPAGEVDWLCWNSPDLYADEMGFLSDGNFTQSERAVIKKVKQKSLLDDQDSGCAVGGDSLYWGDTFDKNAFGNIYTFTENRYDNICYEYTEDMMFLLDTKQLLSLKQNSDLLGDKYYIANYVPEMEEYDSGIESLKRYCIWSEPAASLKHETTTDSYKDIKTCPYILRTPYAYGYIVTTYSISCYYSYVESGTRIMELNDKLSRVDSDMNMDETTVIKFNDIEIFPISCATNSGIRPAFYLNEDNARIISGSGTEADPYVLTSRFNNNDAYDRTLYVESNYTAPPIVSVFLNGSKLELDKYVGYDRGESTIPLRAVLEAMGATVEWDTDTWTITVYYRDKTYEMKRLKPTIIVNGESIPSDYSPFDMGGTSFMDVRLLEEFFDVTVDWSYVDQAFYITQH